MGARQRLNSFYLFAVLIAAAMLGGAAQSWLLFLISAAIMTTLLIHGGDIRPTPQTRRNSRKRR